MEIKFLKGVWAILSILDIKKLKEQVKIYIIATLTCILFAMIYESFSHGVISYFMIFSCIIPLILGVGVSYILCFEKNRKMPTITENHLYNAGVATLTFGSIIEGVLQIYGTTNWKVYIYLGIGTLLLGMAIVRYLIRK